MCGQVDGVVGVRPTGIESMNDRGSTNGVDCGSRPTCEHRSSMDSRRVDFNGVTKLLEEA